MSLRPSAGTLQGKEYTRLFTYNNSILLLWTICPHPCYFECEYYCYFPSNFGPTCMLLPIVADNNCHYIHEHINTVCCEFSSDSEISLNSIIRFKILKWQCAIWAHSQNPQQPVTLADTYLQISLMVTDIQNISRFGWNLQSFRFSITGAVSVPIIGVLLTSCSKNLITPNHN